MTQEIKSTTITEVFEMANRLKEIGMEFKAEEFYIVEEILAEAEMKLRHAVGVCEALIIEEE